jgi:hypothetical protein
MSWCASCGGSLTPGKRFCTTCGTAVVARAALCVSCGHKLRAGTRFCARCGTAVPDADGPRPEAPLRKEPLRKEPLPVASAGITASGVWERLGVGGLLMIVAAILVVISISTPWFNTTDRTDSLRFNEGFVMVSAYQTYDPPSPISADIGYFAVILAAAWVLLGLLSVFGVAPDWRGRLDRAWLQTVGRVFADRGICLLVVVAIVARFATKQDGTVYASGIYLFLLAAILLAVGSLMAGARIADEEA